MMTTQKVLTQDPNANVQAMDENDKILFLEALKKIDRNDYVSFDEALAECGLSLGELYV